MIRAMGEVQYCTPTTQLVTGGIRVGMAVFAPGGSVIGLRRAQSIPGE
jgi:hypothetical protein